MLKCCAEIILTPNVSQQYPCIVKYAGIEITGKLGETKFSYFIIINNFFCDNFVSGPLNNRLPSIREENDDDVEPPPPYTPGRGRYSFRKAHYTSPQFTPNEPPPPYEIDSREATDV